MNRNFMHAIKITNTISFIATDYTKFDLKVWTLRYPIKLEF